MITSTAPIAVFGGAPAACIPSGEYVFGCGPIVEQIPATGAWGRHFLTVPFRDRVKGDTYRVLARDNGTIVTVDGTVVATLARAQIYQTLLSSTANHSITTSNPSLVAQYSNNWDYENNPSTTGLFMMLITPTEQFQTSYTIPTPSPDQGRYFNFISVVAKAADAPSCQLDGSPITDFTPIDTTDYVGTNILTVTDGAFHLSCPGGFGAYSYGYKFFSGGGYGYSAGMGMKFISAPRCDVNGDGQIDSRDVNLIFSARNTPANSPEDQRDADGDLQITVADARTCQQKCTHAGCAIQ
jgi:hypothetical protein